jgi:transcriptional regulator with XRE-family HTH domain
MIMTFAEVIAKRIKELRKERKISINRLSVLAGLSRQSVYRYVRYEINNPNIQNLYLIAQGFNMTLSEFIVTHIFN